MVHCRGPLRPSAAVVFVVCAATLRLPAQDPELEALRRAAEEEAGAVQQVEEKPSPVQVLNAFNPRLTVFGDGTYTYARGDLRNDFGDLVSDRFSLREVELDLRADVDPHAKGVVILSWGEERPDEYTAEVEEGYVELLGLPWNLGLKAGRFYTDFGQIQKLHTHDLPTTNRPLVIREFLGEESWRDTGVSLELPPLDLERGSIRLTYQLLNGSNDRIMAGSADARPAHLGRLSFFREVGERGWIEAGTSWTVGASEAAGGTSVLGDADLTWVWRPADGSARSFVLQAEGFWLDRELGGASFNSYGGFGQALYQLDRWWFFALRGDWTGFADRDDGKAFGASVWVSKYTSEFLRFRAGVEWADDPREDADWRVHLQLTFVFGSHPPEPYWVFR